MELTDILRDISQLLSYLSFWWLLIGIFLWLMRGMGPPGVPSVDKKKFHEMSAGIKEKLKSDRNIGLVERFVLYCGKYFFVYHYYRNDLIFYWAIGGGMSIKLISILIGSMA